MRVFNQGNWNKDVCFICKTKKKGKVVLVGVDGTQKGFNIQAIQVHLDCLELRITKDKKIIYQKLK